jgi:hypothetical protein
VQSFTFPKTAGGDAIYYGGGPCTVFFPYNVGRILSQDGDSVKFLVKSHVESRAVPCRRPPRGPRQCRQLIPALEIEDPGCNRDGHSLGIDQLARKDLGRIV